MPAQRARVSSPATFAVLDLSVLLDQAKSTRKRILREDKLSDLFPPPLQCGVCCALRAAIDYLLPKLFRIFGCLLDTPARQNANGFAFALAYSYLRASNNSSGMEDRLEKYLRFIREVERLKSVERTAWTTSGRRESTAEHSWRLAFCDGAVRRISAAGPAAGAATRAGTRFGRDLRGRHSGRSAGRSCCEGARGTCGRGAVGRLPARRGGTGAARSVGGVRGVPDARSEVGEGAGQGRNHSATQSRAEPFRFRLRIQSGVRGGSGSVRTRCCNVCAACSTPTPSGIWKNDGLRS